MASPTGDPLVRAADVISPRRDAHRIEHRDAAWAVGATIAGSTSTGVCLRLRSGGHFGRRDIDRKIA
jgi:hypothetical protein